MPAPAAWSDYLFDYKGLQAFGTFLQTQLDRDAFDGCLASIYIVPIRKLPRRVALPFEASDAIDAPVSFGVGLYSMIPPQAAGTVAKIMETSSRCLDRCLELGGQPYRYGWHRLNESHHRMAYGAAHERLLALRKDLGFQLE